MLIELARVDNYLSNTITEDEVVELEEKITVIDLEDEFKDHFNFETIKLSDPVAIEESSYNKLDILRQELEEDIGVEIMVIVTKYLLSNYNVLLST
jgi:hypothetical protein